MVQQLERSYAIIHYTISVRIPCLLTDLKHNVLQIVKKLNTFLISCNPIILHVNFVCLYFNHDNNLAKNVYAT